MEFLGYECYVGASCSQGIPWCKFIHILHCRSLLHLGNLVSMISIQADPVQTTLFVYMILIPV